MADAIPAATLVLFRDRAEGPPELLIVERAAAMAFAGGALVFPGGRIDPGDHALAVDETLARRTGPLDPDDAAARIAAIRETLEESGIAPAFVAMPDDVVIGTLRTALAAGEPFGSLLARHGLAIDLDALIPFARWRPNLSETRTFDTRFYIARAPADASEPRVDETENVQVFWASAAALLSAADRGEVRIIFPTRRNLDRLATLASFDAARAHALAHPIQVITPWIEERESGKVLCISTGLGYPVTEEAWATVTRG